MTPQEQHKQIREDKARKSIESIGEAAVRAIASDVMQRPSRIDSMIDEMRRTGYLYRMTVSMLDGIDTHEHSCQS